MAHPAERKKRDDRCAAHRAGASEGKHGVKDVTDGFFNKGKNRTGHRNHSFQLQITYCNVPPGVMAMYGFNLMDL